MVGWNFKSELVIYGEGHGKGNITMDRYLSDIFIPYIEKYYTEAQEAGTGFILEEDNDGGHGTRTAYNKVQIRRQVMEYYHNPPASPDMSIIENVWRYLKQHVKRWKPTTIEELRTAILTEWDNIPQAYINKQVETMPARIAELRKHGGLSTRY